LQGARAGRVIAHPEAATVANAELRVNARGRDRVRAECVKGVHAGVVGELVEGIPADYPRGLVAELGYNPFLFEGFVLLSNNALVRRAAFVHLPPQPKGGARPLLAALYPDDAGLMLAAKLPVAVELVENMKRCRELLAARKFRRVGSSSSSSSASGTFPRVSR